MLLNMNLRVLLNVTVLTESEKYLDFNEKLLEEIISFESTRDFVDEAIP